MNASPIPTVPSAAGVPANENAAPIHVDLLVTDAEVAHELALRAEGRERDDFARQALRLGVLALRHASGALDGQTLQREGDRVLSSVRELLVDRTGQVETQLAKHLDGERSVLAQTLAQHVGKQSPLFKLLSPEQSDGLVATLARTIDRALKAQGDEMLKAVTKEFSQFQGEVRASFEAMKARREEAARSPRHGITFESAVGDVLRAEAHRLGDLYEAVGTLKGQIDRKTGDHVLILGAESGAPDARVVCEAKARKGYTEREALEEIARARKNRGAQVGLVVMERATAPEGIETLRRVGDDVLVVWDPDDVESDLALRLAVSVARALCVREAVADSVAEANLEKLDESIEAIANQIGVIDEIIHSGRLIKRRGEKVVTSGERLRETLEREVAALHDHVKSLRKEHA